MCYYFTMRNEPRITKRLALPLPIERHRELKAMAAQSGEPMTAIIRRALDREIQRLSRQLDRRAV